MNMAKKGFWGFYKLASLVRHGLVYSGNKSGGAAMSGSQQRQLPAAMAVSQLVVGHRDPMHQGLRLLSTNSKPWTKLDDGATKMVSGEKNKVQKSRPVAAAATITTRFTITQWVKWIFGSILSLLLPFWINSNWGKIKRIEGAAEMVMEDAEKVAEVIEKVAIVAEKVSEEVANELPDNTKLKQTALLVERASKLAAHDAQLTQDIIHKVETLKQDLRDLETLADSVVGHKTAK